jgi:hypothetical protein
MTTTNLSLSLREGATHARQSMTTTRIGPDELVNLDITLANFIIPRLEAFRDATDSYPDDLDSLDAWHAELNHMLAAWRTVALSLDNDEGYGDLHTHTGLRLFANRVGHLWL